MYTQTMMIPMNTAKKSQAVHAVALNPVKMLDTITDTIAIVYEVSESGCMRNQRW